MVYCGRPSASCGNCRARKRRCDKADPTCGQCRRMGQDCDGYRDISSLVFRDETTRVIGRVRARKVIRHISTSPETDSPESLASADTPLPASPPASLSILSAASFSADNAISTFDKPPLHGYLEHDIDCMLVDEREEDENEDNQEDQEEDEALSSAIAAPSRSDSETLSFSPPKFDGLRLPSPATPSEDLHLLGLNYFFANFVVPKSGPSSGFLDYIMLAMVDSKNNTALLELGVRAVGLAGLANTGAGPTVVRKARSSYSNALQKVNKALTDPIEARKDSTLLTVMILGLFESITCGGDDSLEAWTRHVNGAASLLLLRGRSQFETDVGLHIFQEALSHLLASCSRLYQPVPPRIRLLRAEATPFIPPGDPAWTVSGSHIEVMDLLHRVNLEGEEPCLESNWESLLSRAVEIDRRLEMFFEKLPVHWCYKTVLDPASSPDAVYHGLYHIYYDTWVAKIWNGMRSCRILLNLVVGKLLLRECTAWAPHELGEGKLYAGMLYKVGATLACLRDDILASVPQLMGVVHHDAATATSHINFCPDGAASLAQWTVPAAGPYFLLWSLYLAGSLPDNSIETREWIISRLTAIRLSMGIQKAQYLADSLVSDPQFVAQKKTMLSAEQLTFSFLQA